VTVLIDTGVVSALLSRRVQPHLAPAVAKATGQRLLLAPQTVAELRFGALAAGWAERRVARLEAKIAEATVVPVTDTLLHRVAEVRLACQQIGHPLAARVHATDLWIAACAIHTGVPLLTADTIFTDVPGLRLA
jgi:predicted nucleic acid-binding protein